MKTQFVEISNVITKPVSRLYLARVLRNARAFDLVIHRCDFGGYVGYNISPERFGQCTTGTEIKFRLDRSQRHNILDR